MDDRLKTAYVTAMKAQHEGSRVELHLGSDVVEYLKSFLIAPAPSWMPRETCWGFPVVDSTASPDHISVHAVMVIQ